MNLAEEQLHALDKMQEFMHNKEPVLCLEGYAGSGKTTVLNKYIKYLDSLNIHFVLCAPTHKAKLVMEEVTGYNAITLHRLLSLAPNIEIFNLDYSDLKFLSSGTNEIPNKGIIIVDEASMITDEIYTLLTDYAKKKKSKLLFVGDPAQLCGVGNGGTSLAFQCSNKVTLSEIHRQSEDNSILPILQKLRHRPLYSFEEIHSSEGSLLLYETSKDFMLEAAKLYKKAVRHQNPNEIKLAAYTNARVKGLNDCMRRIIWRDDNEYHQFEFLTGYENFEYNKNQFYNSSDYVVTNIPVLTSKKIPYYVKLPGYELELYDRVYKKLLNVFILSRTVNPDYIDGLANLIEDVRLSALEAKSRGNRTRASALWRKYFEIMKSFATPFDIMFDNRVIKKKTFDYGYASTVHKLQGTTLDTIFIDMNNLYSCRGREELRQLQYVALSRTKSDVHMLV